MFEFQVRNIGASTGQPDKHGLLHSFTTSDVLVQRIVVEDDGTEHGLRNMRWVESGWTVTDSNVRHADPVSSCWTLAHTKVQRPDGSVAYEGAGLDLDDCIQLLLDENVYLAPVKKYELRETSLGEYEIWLPVADCPGAYAFSGVTLDPEVIIGMSEIEKTARAIAGVI